MEFYDVGSSDLRELWESYLIEPVLGGHDALMTTREEEWGNVVCLRERGNPGVVLRDRLMTDAALGGGRPIKSEHSYSLLACSPPASPVASETRQHTPVSIEGFTGSTCSSGIIGTGVNIVEQHKTLELRSRIDDMEEECYPAISMDTASGRACTSSANSSRTEPKSICLVPARLQSLVAADTVTECLDVKGEPLSAPNSPIRVLNDKETITLVAPHSLYFTTGNHLTQQPSDSEDDDEDNYESMEMEDFDIKCEGSETSVDGSGEGLPPTPPSSASSDSEGTASASCSPERRDSQSSSGPVQNLRGLLGPRFYLTNGSHTHTTRQPIHTSLISCQPKGSTGILTLTDEEKRTLIAEGYPIPTKLPLTKQEEKSLKKVRRKIKNKISAQESRRKKKEYMDGLERRVTTLTNENTSYRDRLSSLEEANRELVLELQRLQNLLESQSS